MTFSDTKHARPLARIGGLLAGKGGLVRDYLAAISGSAGRLVFSLGYFVALANALSLEDFGIFATASAAGVMLSRILAFGFISALYRTATMRPRLLGVMSGGFVLLALLSLPVIAAASAGVYWVFFSADVAWPVFGAVIAAEALLWRPVEAAVIVNNGAGKFGRASVLVILGTVLRAGAALVFAFAANRSLETWTLFYLAANAVTFAIAFAFFYPRQRLRLSPRLYARRLPDSLYVAGAEMLFYLQMEFDKLLVLSMAGPKLAGIYAIIMRLVDLTAIPIRTFTMMLVQKLMRSPGALERVRTRLALEAGVFVVSTLTLVTLAGVLYFVPNALGRNVAQAAPLVALALFIPGLRNLVEYQSELLYARGQTAVRMLNLALLAALKALLLVYLLQGSPEAESLIGALNWAFALIYAASALLTYSALRMPARAL